MYSYFSVDGSDVEFHETAEEAKKAAEDSVQYEKTLPNEARSAHSFIIGWGRFVQQAQVTAAIESPDGTPCVGELTDISECGNEQGA